MQSSSHHATAAADSVQTQLHSQAPTRSPSNADHAQSFTFGSSSQLQPLPTPPQSLHHLPMAQHNNTSAPQGEQPPAHVHSHQAHGPLPLAFNVTHLTNPPLGYAWGPSAYLRSALSEDMWRVAVDVLVETRLLPHCNFAVASDTLVANVPGLTAVPIDPHMPRASGSGAPLVSLEFAVAVLAGFADQRSSCGAESHAPTQPTSHTNPNRLDLSKLLAIRIAHAIDAVRALSAKYDHAQYARAVQHNALVSWLSRAAGQSSGLDPSPLGGAQRGHGMGGLEDVIEEDEPEDDVQDEEDADAIQVDSKLSSSSFSSHAASCTNSAIFHTSSSETLAASMPNPSLSVASSFDRAPNIADMDDPMDCDEGGAISFSSPLPPASTVSVSASAATHSTSATPTTALSSTPTLFVAFADTGRICRATGTADVIQALVQLTDILPWVTQMRSEFGRHFVLLHVVPYAEAVAAAEANASPSVGSPVGILGHGQSQTGRAAQNHQQPVLLDQRSSHAARLPLHQQQPSLSSQTHPVTQQHLGNHPQQHHAQHAQQHHQQQQLPLVQQQGATIEALVSGARFLN